METQESAGGVVIVPTQTGQCLVLLIKDARCEWTFPKGFIEKGEHIVSAAAREISEEAGVSQLELVKALPPVKYYYTWEGTRIRKTVFYYIFKSARAQPTHPQHEEGISEAQWFPLADAKKIVGYTKTNRSLLDQVDSVI